jgi:hypothetical protein
VGDAYDDGPAETFAERFSTALICARVRRTRSRPGRRKPGRLNPAKKRRSAVRYQA